MKTKSHLLVLALAVLSLPCAGYALAQKAPAKQPAHAPKHAQDATPAAKPSASTKPSAPASSSAGSTGDSTKAAPATSGHNVVERESNIEFDERMVKGQTAAGAIYLFQRSPSEFKSIVKVPDTFRPSTTDLLSPRRTSP